MSDATLTAEQGAYVDTRPPAIMLYVGGSKNSFHCEECGANCFHRPKANPEAYECNGCGVWYFGE